MWNYILQMESLVTGCEDGTVALFEQGSNDFAGYVTRSALGLSIRSVAFSPNGQRVAVASESVQLYQPVNGSADFIV